MITALWVGGGDLLLAVLVGLVVALVIRNRDRQITRDGPDAAARDVDAEE